MGLLSKCRIIRYLLFYARFIHIITSALYAVNSQSK